jgi:hypothetical protein
MLFVILSHQQQREGWKAVLAWVESGLASGSLKVDVAVERRCMMTA